MSENQLDEKIDHLLGFQEQAPDDSFVLDVMHGVSHLRRLRIVILTLFGIIGTAFGILGAVLLSDSIARIFTELPVMGIMQAVLFVCGSAAFYTWFMNDDLGLPS